MHAVFKADRRNLCQVLWNIYDLPIGLAKEAFCGSRSVHYQHPRRTVAGSTKRMDSAAGSINEIAGRKQLLYIIDQKPNVTVEHIICLVPGMIVRRRTLIFWKLNHHQ